MTVTRTLFALIASTALVLVGCGPSEGDNCDSADDCGSELVCAFNAVCTTEPCPGICAFACATDMDCGEGQRCGESVGGQRVCQNSRTVP